MRTSDFDYFLPQEMIAQTPCEPRDHSRLIVLSRKDGSLQHRRFFEIGDFLRHGDVLVFNDSRVIPARLFGRKAGTGGKVEVLLLCRREKGLWEALVKPAKRIVMGTKIEFGPEGLVGEVVESGEGGIRLLRFPAEEAILNSGIVPLPPYIHTPLAEPERYQTVYARVAGSVAAPTAGLHFTPELLASLETKGVRFVFVTLHIGLDTFRPVQVEEPSQHQLHREYGELSPEAAEELSRAKAEGRRIICVGTTAVRLVEQAARAGGDMPVMPFRGWTDLFVLPGYSFKVVDGLITNFHLPRSTLLMLVCAFAGKETILRAYQEAINHRYRFYSFGDGMLIL